MGKVKTFNLRYRSLKDQDNVKQGIPSGMQLNDPRESEDFIGLDRLIDSYIHNIPKELRDPFTQGPERRFDPVLYTALLVPWM